jgi:hypothetical protein
VNARGRAQRWKRTVRTAFSERLALKATALALAIVLWFTVSVREPAEQIVRVNFLPSLEPGVVLAEQPSPIRALVRGSGRDLLKLYSTPPALRMNIGGEVGDSLTLALRPADIDLPPGVTAVVRDVQPRRITLVFRHRPGTRPDSAGEAWARPITTNPPAPDTTRAGLPLIGPPMNPGAVDTSSRVVPNPGPSDLPPDTSASPWQ